MGDTVSILADICGILGFIISIFATVKVVKMSRTNKQSAIGKKNKQTMTINEGE